MQMASDIVRVGSSIGFAGNPADARAGFRELTMQTEVQLMKKRSNLKRLAAVAAIIGCQSSGVWAQNTPLTDDQVQALLQRVAQLEQQVKELQQKQPTLIATNGAFSGGLVTTSTGTNASAPPTISLGANGLIARSADSNFTMIAHGYAQVDERNYFGQKTTPDTLLLRRVRPIL
jgi:hypothetical protein